ncbi:hypothetical protein SLS62_003201 [Diatrype stigma]|uniref:FAD/NAD(P)-binding domain-containing protein n=1 Tax=Diatrype stigma TaxID=117547 RepID=A0AAN9UX29_9PEZI
MVKTIVVLGAGMAGLPLAHYLVSKTAAKHSDVRVVLVSPNAEFYWNVASIRFVAAPDQFPEEKYLYPIAKEFAKHPNSKDQFEFVLGKAETLEPDKNSVTIRLNDDEDGNSASPRFRTIDYHTLVIATGSRYRGAMPWKEVGTSQQTRAAIARLQRDIQAARSIVVAGAGVTGVEFAGELASEYLGQGRCWGWGWGGSGNGSEKKEVTIVSADPLPLEPRLRESVRKTAKYELERLGVKFIGGARIIAGADDDDGDQDGNGKEKNQKQKTVELTSRDGSKQTIAADLVIPTYGLVPNTEFAPASMKDASSGRLRQDRHLRAAGHDNVFVLGDAGDLQAPQAINAEAQLRYLMQKLNGAYLETGTVAEDKEEEYKFDPDGVMIGLTIGRDRGTGQVGNFQPWSFFIWALKRDLGASKSAQYAAGLIGFNGAWP